MLVICVRDTFTSQTLSQDRSNHLHFLYQLNILLFESGENFAAKDSWNAKSINISLFFLIKMSHKVSHI